MLEAFKFADCFEIVNREERLAARGADILQSLPIVLLFAGATLEIAQKHLIHRLRRFTQIFSAQSYKLPESVKSADDNSVKRPWYRPSLTTQIMIGLVIGALIGWLRPDWGNKVYFLRDIFINLIKAIIAPLVFSTIVAGIAGAGALKKVGRIGIKALIFFEIVTTVALFIGLAVVNFTKPGAGVTLATGKIDIVKTIGETHAQNLVETIVH